MSEKVKRALSSFVAKLQPIQTTIGTVVHVDTNNACCDVEPVNGSAHYLRVRLRAAVNENASGIIPIPKIGSYVLIGVVGRSDNDAFVLLCDHIESYTIHCDNINLNGDANGGLVMINKLLNSLNRIEQMHNELVATFNAHVHSGNGVITAPPSHSQITQPTQLSDLENTKVKHG